MKQLAFLLMGLLVFPVMALEVKLSPRIRVEPIENAKEVVDMEDFDVFLRKSLVFDNPSQMQEAPYIIAESNDQLLFGKGSLVFVTGEFDKEETFFDVYRRAGKELVHPKTGEELGFVVSVIGQAQLVEGSDPALFKVINAKEGISLGSYLLPDYAAKLPLTLNVKPAKLETEGYILAVEGDISDSIAARQVVVISLGERDGLQEGNTLTIYHAGKKVIDPTSKDLNPRRVQLPETKAGEVLVFKTYEKLSLAIVTETMGVVRLLDTLKNP